jgi:hypothetical protein
MPICSGLRFHLKVVQVVDPLFDACSDGTFLGHSVLPDVVKTYSVKWRGNAYMAAAYLRVVVKVVSSPIATLLRP